jgi:folate-binding protein YgfZ
MVSNDIQGLKPGQGCHAAQLTVKGKLLADLVVYDCGDAGLLIELVSSARAAVQGALDRHLIMDDATVEDLSDAIGELGVYGAGASEALSAITGTSATELAALPMYHFRPFSDGAEGAAPPAFIAATKELGMPGFHVIAGNAALDRLGAGLFSRGGRQLSDDEAEALRIEAGTPLYGIDIDEDRMPAEAGLDDAVSTTKGCYLGQEVVVRLRDRGHLNRKLCGLFFADDGAPPARGTLLRHEAKPNAGVITSAVASPRCGTIALGYVHRLAWEPGTVLELTSADGQPLGRTAQVAPLPFPRKTR